MSPQIDHAGSPGRSPEIEEHPALIVEATRGDRSESVHRIDAVWVRAIDDHGLVVEAWGDPFRPVMPRSAIKPIQAVPLLETAAAAAFELDEVELALACASHNGEEAQAERVERWLHRLELSPNDLECGPQPPALAAAAVELIRSGGQPGPIHNNCSGKHAGFLTVCRHLGLPTAGYIRPDHPLQVEHVTPAVEQYCQVSVSGQTPAIDGCGIPVWTMALANLALGWARLPSSRYGRRLTGAMTAEPYFVAGTGRSCTTVMTVANSPVAVKTGAEGVYCAVLPEEGLGLALKVHDGAARAAEVAVWHLLVNRQVVEPRRHPIANWAGTDVGEIRVVPGLD